jgi:Flp pilus assembly protein TadD
MKTLSLILASLLLAGCATTAPVAPPPTALFNDALFGPSREVIDTAHMFDMSPEMRAYAEREIKRGAHSGTVQQRLFEALYSKGGLKIDYDSSQTRIASETFNAKAGNCMSLVIMTGAFAKDLGLQVQFQNVRVEESWSRTAGFYISASHVNVNLERRRVDSMISNSSDLKGGLTIDFLPPDEVVGHRTTPITEDTLTAMYINNRAAEALTRNELDAAYAWAREGARRYPEFTNTFNTLGVIYLRHGNLDLAERTLTYAMERDPKGTIAMGNLVPVLRARGKAVEADALSARLVALDPHPAFQYFDLGVAAMNKGDYRTARDNFAKEVRRAPYYHEFHFWLALASYRLGEIKAADEQLELAVEMSTTRSDRSRYSSKLEHLRSMQ